MREATYTDYFVSLLVRIFVCMTGVCLSPLNTCPTHFRSRDFFINAHNNYIGTLLIYMHTYTTCIQLCVISERFLLQAAYFPSLRRVLRLRRARLFLVCLFFSARPEP